MTKCSSARPITATPAAARRTEGRKGMPDVVANQVKYAPSVNMAPCPMLMTPISPNTTAKPSAAKANTNVISVASTRTLRAVPMHQHLGPSRRRRSASARASGCQAGPRRAVSLLQWQRLAAGVHWRHGGKVLHLLEHVADARPTLANLHQVGGQDHLIVAAAHRHLALRRLVEREVLEPLA